MPFENLNLHCKSNKQIEGKSRNNIIGGCLGSIIGYIVFILLVDVISKPSNVSIALKPIDSIETYFFGFVFTMGNIGWILGGLLLIGFLAIFFFLGSWICQMIFKN